MSNTTTTNSPVKPQEATSTTSSITVASETSISTSTSSPTPTPKVTTSSTVAPTTAPIAAPNTSPPPPTPTPPTTTSPAQPPSVTTTTVENPPPNTPNQTSQPNKPPPNESPPNNPPPPETSPTTPPDPTDTNTQVTPDKTLPPSFVTVTLSPTSPGGSSVVTIIQTSTHAVNTNPKSTGSQSSSPTSTSELQSDQLNGSSNGLSGNGRIAVAVIVPLLAVTFVVLGALFLFRRRKLRKHAEELRRKEVEEYGYNPNQDPTFPAIEHLGGNESQEMREENAGYRGWGATAPAPAPGRMDSNHLIISNNSAAAGIGMAYSEGETPTHGTMSDTKSDNPLISELNTSPNSEQDPLGTMGPAAASNRVGDINRGSSNASSSYSAANRSDESGEIGNRFYGQQYSPDSYSAGVPHDSTAGRAEMAAQPVIRDVQARRNTRIENPSHFPQQSTGISQNF